MWDDDTDVPVLFCLAQKKRSEKWQGQKNQQHNAKMGQRDTRGETSHYPHLSRRHGNEIRRESVKECSMVLSLFFVTLQLFLCSNGHISLSLSNRGQTVRSGPSVCQHAGGESYVLNAFLCAVYKLLSLDLPNYLLTFNLEWSLKSCQQLKNS